jgi:uncharacterized protein YndB with AHSA1/START domain
MKYTKHCQLFFGLIISLFSLPPLLAQNVVSETLVINRPVGDVFKMFTENTHLEKWLAPKAEVKPEVWGNYDLYWDADNFAADENKGCKILAFEKNNHITFEWKSDESFDHVMNHVHPLTKVSVKFTPINKKQTRISLVHSGWKNTPEWEEARLFHVDKWKEYLLKLEEYASQKKLRI